MNMETHRWAAAIAGVVWAFASLAQDQTEGTRTVLGPTNVELYDGAMALQDNNADEGVRLTLLGLQHAANDKERLTGMSNLCAGYLMQGRFAEALEQCELALAEDADYWPAITNRASLFVVTGRYDEAEADLSRAEELAPMARSVKDVRQLLFDKLNPVEPTVTVDDRRDGAEAPDTE